MKCKPFLLMLLLSASVIGCASKTEAPPPIIDPWCVEERPYRFTHDATIDYLVINEPVLANEILQHNTKGQERCGWVP